MIEKLYYKKEEIDNSTHFYDPINKESQKDYIVFSNTKESFEKTNLIEESNIILEYFPNKCFTTFSFTSYDAKIINLIKSKNIREN